MGSGGAANVPAMLFALTILILLVDQVVADSTDELLREDIYDLDELDDASNDLLEDDHQFLSFGDGLEEYAGYGEDSNYYYGDEYDEYYNTYGMYADEYGYDYFEKESRGETDCTEDDNGKASTKGPDIICPAWPWHT